MRYDVFVKDDKYTGKDYIVECTYKYNDDTIEKHIRDIYFSKEQEVHLWLKDFTKEKYDKDLVIGEFNAYRESLPYFEALLGRKFGGEHGTSTDINFSDLVTIYNDAVKGNVQYKQVTRKGLRSFCLYPTHSNAETPRCIIPNDRFVTHKGLVNKLWLYMFMRKGNDYNNIEFVVPVYVRYQDNNSSLSEYMDAVSKYIKDKYGFKYCKKQISYDKRIGLVIFEHITRNDIANLKTLLKMLGQEYVTIPMIKEYN